jgi:hypothetical protein
MATNRAPTNPCALLSLAEVKPQDDQLEVSARGRESCTAVWKTFLSNPAKQIVAIDFFTIPTLTFHNLYCFIILLHDKRHVIHFNVTAHPTAE